jgi:hypothetical protein
VRVDCCLLQTLSTPFPSFLSRRFFSPHPTITCKKAKPPLYHHKDLLARSCTPFIMPGNSWDDARNYEMAMMFAFLEIVKEGDGKLDHAAVAAKLGDGFTEAGVRFVPLQFSFLPAAKLADHFPSQFSTAIVGIDAPSKLLSSSHFLSTSTQLSYPQRYFFPSCLATSGTRRATPKLLCCLASSRSSRMAESSTSKVSPPNLVTASLRLE